MFNGMIEMSCIASLGTGSAGAATRWRQQQQGMHAGTGDERWQSFAAVCRVGR